MEQEISTVTRSFVVEDADSLMPLFGLNDENIELIKKGGEIARIVRERLNAEGADCKYLHVLAGLSRKSFIGQITGKETSDRLFGTVAADLLAVQYGTTMLRVHDVSAARDSLAVYRAMNEVK